MALLAEAKRKVKYGVDPRNTHWSNDESKFGQRLMEKMGWEKGKGLGAKENGMTEHIKAGYKSDTRGLGCTHKDADAWIAHQDDFNEILKTLNAETGSKEQKDKTDEKKTTDGRKRYYGRFARGSVQTLRSTEDLDCIFGRRKLASEPTPPNTQSAVNSDDSNEGVEEKRHGLTTITSTSSVQEYFAQKMAEIKSRKIAAGEQKNPVGCGAEDAEQDNQKHAKYGAVKFSYEDKPGDDASEKNSRGWYKEWTVVHANEEQAEEHCKKKKRKKEKCKEQISSSTSDAVCDNNHEMQAEEHSGKRKKDKNTEHISGVNNGDSQSVERSRKKRKEKNTEHISNPTDNTFCTKNIEEHSRKKKDSNKDFTSASMCDKQVEEPSRKKKDSNEDVTSVSMCDKQAEEPSRKKRKKKDSNKDFTSVSMCDMQAEEPSRKKRKKKDSNKDFTSVSMCDMQAEEPSRKKEEHISSFIDDKWAEDKGQKEEHVSGLTDNAESDRKKRKKEKGKTGENVLSGEGKKDKNCVEEVEKVTSCEKEKQKKRRKETKERMGQERNSNEDNEKERRRMEKSCDVENSELSEERENNRSKKRKKERNTRGEEEEEEEVIPDKTRRDKHAGEKNMHQSKYAKHERKLRKKARKKHRKMVKAEIEKAKAKLNELFPGSNIAQINGYASVNQQQIDLSQIHGERESNV